MILHGFGGMGKSQLALEYAHAHQGEYTSVWWVNVPNMSKDFVSIAQELVEHHGQCISKTARPDYRRIAISLGLPPHAVTEAGQVDISPETINGVINGVKR
jgi:hypothetical protein